MNRFFATLAVLLALSCSFNGVGKRSNFSIAKWYRVSAVKDGLFNTLVKVDGVFLSCELKEKMLNYKREQEGLTKAQYEFELQKIKTDCERYFDFVVAIYTKDSRWSDLSSPDSMWNIVLNTEYGVREPDSVKEFNPKPDEIFMFYKFYKPWKKMYILRFVRAGIEDSHILVLNIASLIGRISLKWQR